MANQAGTAVFVGRSGMTYLKDVLVVDTNVTLANWDAGDGAATTSPTYWVPPEDVILRDLIVAAATTITKLRVIRNGIATGDMLRVAAHLVSITFRPILNIPVRAGSQIQLTALT